jgi:type II secretory pathway component PulF
MLHQLPGCSKAASGRLAILLGLIASNSSSGSYRLLLLLLRTLTVLLSVTKTYTATSLPIGTHTVCACLWIEGQHYMFCLDFSSTLSTLVEPGSVLIAVLSSVIKTCSAASTHTGMCVHACG